MKLKILFDATMLHNIYSRDSGRSGIFFVAYNLLKTLAERHGVQIYLYSQMPSVTQKFISDFLKKMPNISLYSGDVKKMDVCFSPLYAIPKQIKDSGIPCFTILYDCIPLLYPEYFGEYTQIWFEELRKSLSQQDFCFSISENTTKDFLKFCPQLDANKIKTIPLSTNFPYKPNKNLTAKIREKYHIPEDKKYLFSLCSIEPRKNLVRAIKTFIEFINKDKIDDLVFVLGGGAWPKFINGIEKSVPNYQKYKDKIINAGYVDDEDLEVLYSNAEWFVYTSQYEGFGMPPLEAMACGTAVITSNNSSLPEVVGDAGQMIDWDSEEQHIAAYEKYYFDEKFRNKMAQKGLERSKRFSWEKATDIILESFKKCPVPLKRRSFVLQKLYEPTVRVEPHKTIVKLFHIITLFKIENNKTVYKVKLLGFFPIYSFKCVDGRKRWKFFGLPLMKSITKNYGSTTKYYFFNFPLIKISKKEIKSH